MYHGGPGLSGTLSLSPSQATRGVARSTTCREAAADFIQQFI